MWRGAAEAMKIRDLILWIDSEKCREELLKVMEDYLDKDILLVEESSLEQVYRVLSALSNPIRLRIIGYVMQYPLPVCILSKLLGIDQTLLSHHLKILRDAGIVTAENRGKFRFYRLRKEGLGWRIIMLLNYLSPKS